MRRRLLSLLSALVLAITGTVTASVALPGTAAADGCYTWGRTLKKGMSGSDVTQLQIRVAGWVASGENLVIDGQFGERTRLAVVRFQRGYGLAADGVAGPNTFSKIYALQDNDCTPAHFAYSEMDGNCGANNFNGGKVSAATAKRNTLRMMWQLEAMRHKLGDRPMVVSISFRSVRCNDSVNGASTSRHMYGQATDFSTRSGPTLCQMFHAAKTSGFEEILGPGYPGHSTHTHVANDPVRLVSASRC
ncbi:peptidase M15 [Actinophytocola xinjiangensis]|uniref:Peptidase M15 n=1 Tax=Actinophytocola xinjiangensis TaxID=485602 RepID=A0A7Z1AYU1_9PSEU|nr:M15 family metallopeptidase [Actinophytocola xinjiangensis]OLF10253.1 peptidase M15 [Actinophytocola xinjiangensis]